MTALPQTIYPEWKDGFARLVEQWRDRTIAVLGHVRPDGDCIGCQVALTRFLRAQGIEAHAANADKVPVVLRFLVGDTPFAAEATAPVEAEIAVTVDCADQRRMGVLGEPGVPFVWATDHHVSHKIYAEELYLDGKASATAEILAGLFADYGWTPDPVTAGALYAGIATDTGQFRFGTTSARALRLSAWLIDCGAEPGQIADALYENEPPHKMELLERFLRSFEYWCDGRVCVGTLSSADFAETGATKEDTEGLVDYARAIAGVEIGVLVERRSEGIKGSFRAKQPHHRVDQIAQRFNGGGHACAAGFNLPDTAADTFFADLRQTLEAHFANNAA